MKKLLLLALSSIATAAMATGPSETSEIRITGTSTQIAVLSSTGVVNTANGTDSLAQQNLASNAGDVDIRGHSLQIVAARGSYVGNLSNADTVAQQNLSSNVGDVTISGHSMQATVLASSYVLNSATGRDATAVQNIASNNACFACVTTGSSRGHGHDN